MIKRYLMHRSRQVRELRILLCICSAIVCVATALSAQPAENLAYNGDFELASEKSPPPGWTMWGARKYKIPANYIRDTADPHKGEACFRMYHPAHTGGYIVTEPKHAIRPEQGMQYTVSFWARSDRAGRSMFGFTAYHTVNPFVDAPSPGSFQIGVDTEWKRFSFEIAEGWDFFAQKSRYLLLTFRPASDRAEERTLWVDDIVVSEQPSTHERITDIDSLEYAPLNHRVKPGEKLNLAIDAGARPGRSVRQACGVSFQRVAGWAGYPYNRKGEYVLPREAEQAIRDLHLPMMRFYGVGDEPFPVDEAIDKIAELCSRFRVPQEWVVSELETHSADTALAPDVWARAVQHSVDSGYEFCRWEISNEPYSSMWGKHGKAFASPDHYIDHVIAVSKAIRAVQPEAKIGIGIHSGSVQWGNYVLKKTAGSYDSVACHNYWGGRIHQLDFETLVITENAKKLEHMLQMNALIKSYNPDGRSYQLDTEWGCHSSGTSGERADYVKRNGNIWGTMHRAVRMIYYVREDILRGASAWEMFSRTKAPGFGMFYSDALDKRSLFYWLYYLFNRHVGEHVVGIRGTAPYHTPPAHDRAFAAPLTPAVATLSSDSRQLHLIIANGSWEKSIPGSVTIDGFSAGVVSAAALSHSDADAHPMVERKADVVKGLHVEQHGQNLNFVLPPHSVVFITVNRSE